MLTKEFLWIILRIIMCGKGNVTIPVAVSICQLQQGPNLSTNQLKCITAHKATTDITTHRVNPCTNGFTPTDFKTEADNPAPIKNKVTVNPILAK